MQGLDQLIRTSGSSGPLFSTVPIEQNVRIYPWEFKSRNGQGGGRNYGRLANSCAILRNFAHVLLNLKGVWVLELNPATLTGKFSS